MSNWGNTPEGHGLGVAYIDYKSQVAAVVDVTVNLQSGAIKVHNAWIAIDCGLAVQPDNVIAQQMGCTVYGLGLALSESISMHQGIVEQTNFHNYRIPRMSDIPNIEIEIVHTPNPPSGAGQMATPLIAPAISNAVAASTGVRLRHMPMTPARVLQTLNRQDRPPGI
ncbi:MAG: molybdopterin-dependent oxidoreductase [Proteobacteria bacterium]|nr:molybdopterin-dependent oxidoreductase [Pseudomonadota bacterium]